MVRRGPATVRRSRKKSSRNRGNGGAGGGDTRKGLRQAAIQVGASQFGVWKQPQGCACDMAETPIFYHAPRHLKPCSPENEHRVSWFFTAARPHATRRNGKRAGKDVRVPRGLLTADAPRSASTAKGKKLQLSATSDAGHLRITFPAAVVAGNCSRKSAHCRKLPQSLRMAVSFVLHLTASLPFVNRCSSFRAFGWLSAWKRPMGFSHGRWLTTFFHTECQHIWHCVTAFLAWSDKKRFGVRTVLWRRSDWTLGHP